VAGTHTQGFNGDGPADATTLQINGPNGLYCLPDGTLYIYDAGNHRIRRLDTAGQMTTVINDMDPFYSFIGRGLWVSPAENLIYYADGTVIKRWSPGESPTVVASDFLELGNIAMHPISGLLYVTDRASTNAVQSAVYRIETDGTATRVAGNGSTTGGGDGFAALSTGLDQVRGITFRPNGGYFLCTHKGGHVWYVDTAGIIHLYLEGRGNNDVRAGDGLHPPIFFDVMSEPRSVTLTPRGDLLIVTNDSGYVRVVKSACPPPVPELGPVTWLAQGLRVSWSSQPTVPYIVERTTDLTDESWEVVAVETASGATTEFIDPLASQSARAFYRVSPPR
jgi:sugar lactone lactonase YvrE